MLIFQRSMFMAPALSRSGASASPDRRIPTAPYTELLRDMKRPTRPVRAKGSLRVWAERYFDFAMIFVISVLS